MTAHASGARGRGLAALEATGFAVLAAALHVALFAALRIGAADGGAAGGAAGGGPDAAQTMILRGGGAQTARLIAAWETPPGVAPSPRRPPAPKDAADPAPIPRPGGGPPVARHAATRPAAPRSAPGTPPPAGAADPASGVAQAPIPARRPAGLETAAAHSNPGEERRAQDQAPRRSRTGPDGSGGGQTATAAAPGGTRQTLLQAFGAEVRAAVARRKRYPRPALRRGREGVVRIVVTIDRRGGLLSARLARSSGRAALDRAALAAARAVGRYPAPPAGLSGRRFSFAIPMRFALR